MLLVVVRLLETSGRLGYIRPFGAEHLRLLVSFSFQKVSRTPSHISCMEHTYCICLHPRITYQMGAYTSFVQVYS